MAAYLSRFRPGILLLGLFPLLAQAELPHPHQLLALMIERPAQVDYRGSFTYEQGAILETFTVTHWVEDGVAHERLTQLSGPEHQVLRQSAGDDCASTGKTLLRQRLHRMGERLGELDQLYQMDVLGVERVASRPAIVLQMVPRDPYRYGYILSIDPESGLLLKSLLLNEQGQLLERFQFVELQLDPELDELAGEPTTERHRVADPAECADASDAVAPSGWQLAWVPPGFAFAGQQRVGEELDMLKYTDGLATFSVFLDRSSDIMPAEGHAQRGATNAYIGHQGVGEQQYRVTVVGEVPSLVAEQVAQNVVRHPGAQLPAPGNLHTPEPTEDERQP